MNKKPALSIMTPVYNGFDFINRCYNNLLSQTFSDWEWIVVDDGSIDGTPGFVKKLAFLDDRVKLISYKSNKGRGYARTMSLKESMGEWVVVWDVDDLNFPDRLDQINKARIEGYDYFCSYAVVVDNELNIKGVRGFLPTLNGLPRGFVHPTLACRTDIAKMIGYKPNIRTGEDAKIIWTLSAKFSGLWFEDALTIYQEDNEVNLLKAIDSNLGQLKLINEMFKEGTLIGVQNYILINFKYLFKLMLLNIFRYTPSLYWHTVKIRNYGEKKSDWKLSSNRIGFVKQTKEKI